MKKRIFALLIAMALLTVSVCALAEPPAKPEGTPPAGQGGNPPDMPTGNPPDGMGTPPDGMGNPPDGMGGRSKQRAQRVCSGEHPDRGCDADRRD